MSRIFFFIFISISAVCHAQSATDTDSLKNILRVNNHNDSNRVRTLLNLANVIIYNNPDYANKYADAAMRLAQKIKWQKGVALSYRQKGYVYYISSDYAQAMDYYLKALKEGEAMQNSFFNATIYNNIANIYADLKDYKKALNYYFKYLSISQKLTSKTDEMNGDINIGDVYTELDSLSLGLAYFNNALRLAGETNNKRLSAAILNNRGEIYLKTENYDSAYSDFQKTISVANETGNLNAKATALNSLGKIYLYHHKYREAEDLSDSALSLAKELGDISWQANALETLSSIYQQRKEFARALDTYKQSVVLKDSTLNDVKKQDITRLEMQYRFNEREAGITAANDKKHALAVAEINKQKVIRNAAIGIGSMLVLAAIAGILLYKRRKDTIEKKKEAEFNAKVANTELKALRAQMNPHFIFNSLNSINDYIDKHDTKMATLYTTKFAKLMRMILENSEQKEISLADDLKALELYMQLESIRMKNKFTYQVRIDETIDIENTLIPPLLLQPFVENSIWHGIAKKEGHGEILISIEKKENMIHFTVEDNGVGLEHEPINGEDTIVEGKKSLGVKITKSRIEILNSIKKSNAAITMSQLDQGTKIEINLPEELAF